MGWTDDEIDKLAKNASANQKVEYNNAYWKEMEALLDAEKPAKKRFGWWFFGAMTVLIIIGTGLYYRMDKTIKKDTVLAHDLTNVQTNEQANPLLQPENDSFTEEQNQIVNQQSLSMNTKEISSEEHQILSVPSSAKTDLNSLKRRDVSTFVHEKSDDSEKTVQNDQLNGKFELAAFASDQNIIPDFETERNFQEDKQEENEQQTETSQSELLENEVAKNMAEDPTLQKRIGFYVAAGAGAGASYIKTSNELMIQWRVNMGVDYTIANNFRFGAGAGFRQQLVNNLTVERSREYYSFGLIDVNQSINYDRLQFVDLNVHAHYLFRKMAVGIEITPSYLVSVRANMKQTQIEYDNSFVDEVMTTKLEKQFVKSDNFNSFGLDAGISFHYQFKYKMSIQAVASTRLNKILTNNDFRGEQNRFPVKLELGLIKRF